MSGGALRAVQAAWNKLIDLPAIDFTEHEAREIVAGIGHELRATAHGDEPVAWMLRAARALHTRSARQYGEFRVLCGKVFMSEEAAKAAAKRETNSWRKVEAFPVYADQNLRPALAKGICVSNSVGHPDPAERRYRLIFSFSNLTDLQAAHQIYVEGLRHA